MKKSILFFVSLLVFFGASAQKLSKEQAKADLKFCFDALKTSHPSVFRYTKETEFNTIYRFLDARIVDSIELSDFAEISSTLVSTTRCVHTTILNGYKSKSKLVFNLSFIINNNKLYARGFANANDTVLYRIMSIDKVSAIAIVDRMLMLRSGDGYEQSFPEAYFSKNFNMFYNVLYSPAETVSFIVKDQETEKEFKVERQKKFTNKYKLYDWDGAVVLDTITAVKLMKLKNIPDTRILKISSFKKKNTDFYKKIFADMERDSVENIVIDVRQNGGGNIYHAFNLLNTIIDKDIYMYAEKRRAKVMPYLSFKGKTQYVLGLLLYDVFPNGQRWNDANGRKYYRYSYKAIAPNKFKPKVYVLTDGISVSASSLLVAYLKYYNNAEVIGVESGGTYTGNNGRAFPEFQLPNSKIKVSIPLQYINYFPGVPNVGHGVKVDHYMSPLLDRKSQELFIQSILLERE